MTATPDPRDAELLRAYFATTWSVELADGTLSVRLDRPAALPPDLLPAAIVTAYNPASEPRDPEWNRAAHARLRRSVASTELPMAPTVAHGSGADADRWTEPGLLIGRIEAARAVALGREFGQNAIVWIEADGRPSLRVTRPGFCGGRPGDRISPPA